MAEQILIEFVGDSSKLEPAIDQLAKAGQVSDKDAASFKKLNTEGSKAFTGLANSSKTAIKSIGDVQKSAQKLADVITDEVAGGMADALDEAGVTVEEFSDALKKAGVGATQLAENTDQVTTANVSLKKELKDINAQLAVLKDRGQSNSEQYLKLKERAGELKDTLADVSEEVARAGSDTRGFDNLIQIASGVTAGFAVAQGSMALFGEGGEKVQEVLLKVNAAMAILQGLQQIQAILVQKNFQSLTALVGVQTIELAQTKLSTAAESENIVVKYLAIAAQKALNAALAISPLVLVAAAVTAIAIAYDLFTSKSAKALESQKKMNAALEQSLKLYDQNIEAIGNTADLVVKKLEAELSTRQEIAKATQEGLSEQIEQAKQAKKQADDNYAIAFKNFGLKKKLNDDEKQAFTDANDKKISSDQKFYSLSRQLSSNQFEQQKADLEDSIKSYQAFADAKVALAKKGSIAELEAQIDAVKAAEKATKQLNPDLTSGDLAKLAAETNKTIIDLENQIQIKLLEDAKSLMVAKLATIKEGSIEELQEQKLIAEQTTKIELAQLGISDAKKKELRAEDAKEQQEFDRQIRDRRLQFDLDEINTRINQAKQGSVAEFSAQLDLLRKEQELDLNAKGVTDTKRLEIETKYQKDVLALTRQFNAQTQTETINTKQAEINQKLADLQKLSTSENNDQLLQLKKDAIEQQAQLDIVSAAASINNEQLLAAKILEIREKAKADKLAIDQEAAVRTIDFAKNLANAELEIEKSKQEQIAGTFGFNIRARQDANAKILAIERQELANELTALEEKHNKGLISEEDYQLQLAQLRQKFADEDKARTEKIEQEKKDIITAGFQILTDGVSAFYDIQSQKRQDDLDKSIAALEARKTAELDNKNLTEAQKANIDQKYALKEAQAKRKAFEADKQAKKQQAIINGALAIVNALATAPTIIAGIILAAVVAADTAFQIAKINSAQAPAFKKGTRSAPKGLKRVGEEGPELSYKAGEGYKWLGTGGEELIWSKGGERIYPHKESMEIAASWRGGSSDEYIRSSISQPNNEALSAMSVDRSGKMTIDYQALAGAIVDAIDIPEPVQVINSFDEDGMTNFIVKNGNRLQQLNKRYKIG